MKTLTLETLCATPSKKMKLLTWNLMKTHCIAMQSAFFVRYDVNDENDRLEFQFKISQQTQAYSNANPMVILFHFSMEPLEN